MCDEVRQLLSQMAQEPRDPAWAADMETKLRDDVMTVEPGKYSIRAIECRASLCAVEAASLDGLYFGHLDSNEYLDRKLLKGMDNFGYEIDPSSGSRVTVTVRMFKRR